MLASLRTSNSRSDWLTVINVALELHKWAIGDGLGNITEDDPKTCHHNFDPPRRGWLPHFGSPTTCTRSRALYLKRSSRCDNNLIITFQSCKDWLIVINDTLELRNCAINDSLRNIPEDYARTYYHNFDLLCRGRLLSLVALWLAWSRELHGKTF